MLPSFQLHSIIHSISVRDNSHSIQIADEVKKAKMVTPSWSCGHLFSQNCVILSYFL